MIKRKDYVVSTWRVPMGSETRVGVSLRLENSRYIADTFLQDITIDPEQVIDFEKEQALKTVAHHIYGDLISPLYELEMAIKQAHFVHPNDPEYIALEKLKGLIEGALNP